MTLQTNFALGVQWVPSDEGLDYADGRLFYLGMQDLYYTYTMFIVQGKLLFMSTVPP